MESKLPDSKNGRVLLGKWGEDRTCEILQKLECKVLQRNFRISRGEVDIIAMEHETLCFIEVKSWNRELWPDLALTLNRRKIMRMRGVAQAWLQANTALPFWKNMRFDLFLVDPKNESYEWLRSALDI